MKAINFIVMKLSLKVQLLVSTRTEDWDICQKAIVRVLEDVVHAGGITVGTSFKNIKGETKDDEPKVDEDSWVHVETSNEEGRKTQTRALAMAKQADAILCSHDFQRELYRLHRGETLAAWRDLEKMPWYPEPVKKYRERLGCAHVLDEWEREWKVEMREEIEAREAELAERAKKNQACKCVVM